MTRTSQQPGSGLVTALEGAWTAIQAQHPDVPAAVVITGAGSTGARGALRLGHFAAGRWQTQDQGEPVGEIFVGGEGLKRGPLDVFGTLLHEAAHAVAFARGVQDCSRQGRYHNTRYRQLAAELGLTIERDPVLGWTVTTVPASTRDRYAPVIATLGQALTLHRAAEHHAPGSNRSNNPAPCLCGCGRRIRVAPSVLAQGPISCGICEQPFAPAGGRAIDDPNA